MKTSSVEQLILGTLTQEHAHLTAYEIYSQLKLRLPAVNPSTVYRALERMAHAGKVSISDMGQGAAVYEMVGGEQHHHLVCQSCGQVLTMDDTAVKSLFRQLEEKNNFQMVTNHLVLFGYCAQCSQKTY